MLPVLRRGTVLEVCKPFDNTPLGDRGVITKEALPEGAPKPVAYMPGPVLHIYRSKPTAGGWLPIYNSGLPELVEDGTLRIVEEVTHEISDEEMEAIRTRMEEYQDPKAYHDEREVLTIDLSALDVGTRKGREELDRQVFAVLLKKGATPFRTFLYDYVTEHQWEARYDILQESAHRLVVAGKILPIREGAVLIPCR